MVEKIKHAEKFDAGKAQHHLMPPDALEQVLQVLAYGAEKYEPHNWKRGMRWSRLFNAAMRHIWAWWRGEKLDPESGLPHLAHAICSLMFLIGYDENGWGDDDRECERDGEKRHPLYMAFEELSKKSAEPIGGEA